MRDCGRSNGVRWKNGRKPALVPVSKSKNTTLNYIPVVRQFAQFLNKPLTAATKQDVRAFLGHLCERHLQPSTMAAKLHALRSFYGFLELGDQVRVSVPQYLATRKIPQRLPHAKSEEEIERLIAAARNPRDLAILELGYASGLRVNELANLRVEDVNLRARSLIVREGKGGKDRIGLFGRSAAEALREYLGDRTTGSLFRPLPPRRQRGAVFRDRWGIWYGQWREPKQNGKRITRTVRLGDYELPTRERARMALHDFLGDKLGPHHGEVPQRGLTTRQLWRIIAGAARRAGIGHVHPHMLRHSCATHCLNNGMDIRFVQELLGHANPSTTAKYLHIATEKLLQTYTKFHPHGVE